MDAAALDHVRPYLELGAVAAGAVSGALHAVRRSFDVVGVVVIGVATGTGGGLIRDMLLGQGPALALRSPDILMTAVLVALVAGTLGGPVSRLGRMLWAIDSLALGLFAVAGVQRAESADLTLVPCVFLGVISCVGGGLIRDVLCRDTPVLLLPGPPYSVTALLASAVYLTAVRGLHLPTFVAELTAVAAGALLRVIAAWRRWTVPTPPDFSRIFERRRPRQD